MKFKIGIILSVVTLCAVICFCLFGQTSYSDDVIALAEYLQYFEKPEAIVFTKLEKFVFEEQTIYHLDISDCDDCDKYDKDEDFETELLIVIDHKTKVTSTAFFADMECGLKQDIKNLWDSRNINAKSFHVFSDSEIQSLVSSVSEYLKIIKEHSKKT